MEITIFLWLENLSNNLQGQEPKIPAYTKDASVRQHCYCPSILQHPQSNVSAEDTAFWSAHPVVQSRSSRRGVGELPVLTTHASWSHRLHHHTNSSEGLWSRAQRAEGQPPFGIPVADLCINRLGLLAWVWCVLGNAAAVDSGSWVLRIATNLCWWFHAV